MIEIPGKIPIAIHPFFWATAALLGWMSSGTLLGTLIWIGIIFFSVLFHEFGHAIAAVSFKQKARIQLVALGGLTSFTGPKLKFWQQFIITFNGPFFGFLLFLAATFALQWHLSPILFKAVKLTQIANLFWSVLNLLPVLPLDGGHLLRIVLEAFFGLTGFRISLLIGTTIATILSFYFFMVQNFLLGAFLFLFAFQQFDSWRKSRFATREDRDDRYNRLLESAEKALAENRVEQAKELLTEVQAGAKGSLLAAQAAQYLAFLLVKEGKREQAYEMLLPVKDKLADEALCLLQELGAERKNYTLVAELAVNCYQVAPSQKRALDNARAFGALERAQDAGGWLQTAWQFGGLDVASVVSEEEFKKVRDNQEFKAFVNGLL